MDVGIMSSSYEVLGLAAVEYMMNYMPTIGNDTGATGNNALDVYIILMTYKSWQNVWNNLPYWIKISIRQDRGRDMKLKSIRLKIMLIKITGRLKI